MLVAFKKTAPGGMGKAAVGLESLVATTLELFSSVNCTKTPGPIAAEEQEKGPPLPMFVIWLLPGSGTEMVFIPYLQVRMTV